MKTAHCMVAEQWSRNGDISNTPKVLILKGTETIDEVWRWYRTFSSEHGKGPLIIEEIGSVLALEQKEGV